MELTNCVLNGPTDWKTAFESGLQPSAAVGAALFPAITCMCNSEEGLRLRVKIRPDAAKVGGGLRRSLSG